MNFVAGLLITGLMAVLPLAFAVDFNHPPTELTGWLGFIIALCGVLGIIQFGLMKYILKPAIMEQMKGMPTQKDFLAHTSSDKEFQDTVTDFMEEIHVEMGIERRRKARRVGDPR